MFVGMHSVLDVIQGASRATSSCRCTTQNPQNAPHNPPAMPAHTAALRGLPQPLNVAEQPAGPPLGRRLQGEDVGRGGERLHLRLGELRLVIPPAQHLVRVAGVAAQPAQRTGCVPPAFLHLPLCHAYNALSKRGQQSPEACASAPSEASWHSLSHPCIRLNPANDDAQISGNLQKSRVCTQPAGANYQWRS